jgi:general secretion pathway protein N
MKDLFAAIRWRWIALGLGAYALFLIMTAPATLLTKRLQQQGILASGVSGTVWEGRAASLQVRGFSVGAVQWKLHPTHVFLGRLNIDVDAKRNDGSLVSNVSLQRGGKVTLRDLRVSLPIPTITGFASMRGGGMATGMLGGWKGTLEAQLGELVIENNWPVRIAGRIDATDLVGPARQPTAIGSYRIEFPAAQNAAELQGNIASHPQSPLDVVGVVRLLPGRQYVIDAQVGTRSEAPASISKALEYLGPPDAQGRRPLSMSGSI